jgi:hypothetical protein
MILSLSSLACKYKHCKKINPTQTFVAGGQLLP